MGRIDKLIAKFKTTPKNFTYQELQKLLSHLGYTEDAAGKTSGSRLRFINEKGESFLIHRPHPQNELKEYVVKDILEKLIERGELS